jgi:hypothetical protein
MADFSVKLSRNSGFKPVLAGTPWGKSSLAKGTYVGVDTIEIRLRETCCIDVDCFRVAMDQLSALVNMSMYRFFLSCLSTKFLTYRQPAFAGTWCESCNARGRHKRDTLYLRGPIKDIQLYTRILLLGVFMCEIYGGLKCAGSISISYQCYLFLDIWRPRAACK